MPRVEANKTYSIADAIRSGESVEDIKKSFEKALQEAEAEVNAEKEKEAATAREKEANLAETREHLVLDLLDYLILLDIIPKDEVTGDVILELEESLEEVEKNYRARIATIKSWSNLNKVRDAVVKESREKRNKVEPDADRIIKEFLKSL
jgi:gamma-glutamylcysteine synthetase